VIAMEGRWWTTFPRKIGIPNKMVCNNSSEFLKHYTHFNGTVPKLYIGLYGCDTNGEMGNVTLDVVGFDMDGSTGFDSMKKFHSYLLENDIMHSVMFSTGGFWIYVIAEPKTYSTREAKGRLVAMQQELSKGPGLEWGKSKKAALDISILGDIERLTRMPTSYDVERQRYAIFLSDDDISKDMDHITKVASDASDNKRKYGYFLFGTNKIDPDKYTPIYKMPESYYDIGEIKYNFEIPEDLSDSHLAILDTLPECVKAWVASPEDATWEARAFATLYLREKGFTKEQTENFLKPFYEKHPRSDRWKNNWEHYKHSAQTSDNIYKRGDLKFPNCASLQARGLCNGGCIKKHGKDYSLVYRPRNTNI
jgi:hypothetical protein